MTVIRDILTLSFYVSATRPSIWTNVVNPGMTRTCPGDGNNIIYANMTRTIQTNNFWTVNCTFRGCMCIFILIANKHDLQIKIYGRMFSTHWASFLTLKMKDECQISKLSVYDALAQHNVTPALITYEQIQLEFVIFVKQTTCMDWYDNYLLCCLQLLLLVGEAFDEETDIVNGCVINIRSKGNKIAIWTGEARKEEAVCKVG